MKITSLGLLKILAVFNLLAFVTVIIEPYDGAWDGLWFFIGMGELFFSVAGLAVKDTIYTSKNDIISSSKENE